MPTLQGEGAGGPERTPAEVVTLVSSGGTSQSFPPRASTDTTVNLDSQQGAVPFGAGLNLSHALQNVKRTHTRTPAQECVYLSL